MDYDARVARTWSMDQVARRHDQVVCTTAAVILAENELGELAETRMRLHVKRGGASLPSTADKAAAGPLVQVALCLPTIQRNSAKSLHGL